MVATVFQTGIRSMMDTLSLPLGGGQIWERHMRPTAGSEVSRPCLETLGCVGLQSPLPPPPPPPPRVFNTYCPFSVSCTAQETCSWLME